MNRLHFNLCILFYIIVLCLAADETTASSSTSKTSTSSSTSKTLVWVTGTDSNGKTVTTESPFYQLFMSTYTTTTGTVPSGSIGITGDDLLVGKIRKYSSTTISGSGSAIREQLIIGAQKVIGYKIALITSTFLVTLLVM